MNEIKRLRCSSLPSAFTCPESVRPVTVEIDPVSEPADQGSAGHEVMQAIVEMDAKSIDGIDLVAIARRHGADEDELRIQAFLGIGMWKELRGYFPEAQAEVRLRATFDLGDGMIVELTGHVDALSVPSQSRAAMVGDWKFGRADKNHSHQVRGYQALVLANYDQVDEVRGFVGWMLAKDIEPYSMNRDQMWEWLEELKKTVLEAKGTYHPGEQCTYCRRNHDCAAMTAMARRDVLVLGEPGMADRVTAGFPDLPDRDLIALYRRGKVIARIIDDVTQATRRRVEAAPGRALPDGEGRELRIVETAKRVIDPILAHPVLEERFTPAEIAACTIIRPSRLDNAISEKTERGGKKAAIEELDEALRAAGAVTDEPSERMIDARTKEPGA